MRVASNLDANQHGSTLREKTLKKKSVMLDVCFIVIWMFPQIRVPQNGWFIMGNPIKTYLANG